MSLNSTIFSANNFDNKSTEGTDKLTKDLSLAIQASMAFIGFIGNSLTFITLKKNGDIFAASILKPGDSGCDSLFPRLNLRATTTDVENSLE